MKTIRKLKRRDEPVRFHPSAHVGLTTEQVDDRLQEGAVNAQAKETTSVSRIVLKNTLTPFNLISLALAVIIVAVGHPENTLFFGIVICNTAMGIFQELRARRTLDKLSVLAQTRVTVVRDGLEQSIPQDEIVLDDIVLLTAGDQVCADAIVVESGGLEVDESLLTGESDRIHKGPDDKVFSGSYVTGGRAFVRACAVGEDNYANALTAKIKRSKKHKSRLLHVLNIIILVLTIIIVPLGLLLFWSSYSHGETLQTAVLGAAAAMTGMIPSGLVLLTGVTLTVGAMNLARRKALVQSLPSIETLARVDVLCLDKTGTITDGKLVFEHMESVGGAARKLLDQALSELLCALRDQNATASCLRAAFGESNTWYCSESIPFSSDRKWSGATFRDYGTWVMGAPAILFPNGGHPFLQQANQYASQGYRVICLARSAQSLQSARLPAGLTPEALILLSDNVRKDAEETFRFFADEGVTLKVISGDNPHTVGAVATKAGLASADRIIDMSAVPEGADYAQISEEYTIFGHVTPDRKQELIRGMKQNGHTTCMTGDGVNDILAMREADCSVAMVGGSSAARSACDFVLLTPTFGAMVNVLREGRRVINNIERVAALYMVNTIYSVILALVYTLLPLSYPYAPLQMTPVNALTVGIPSFILALQANYSRPTGRFVPNIFEHSLPAALTIVFNTLYLQLAGIWFQLDDLEISTMVVFLVGAVGFYLLLRISKPYTPVIKVMLIALAAVFVVLFMLPGNLFMLDSLINRNVFFYLPLLYFSFHIHGFLGNVSRKGMDRWQRFRAKQSAQD